MADHDGVDGVLITGVYGSGKSSVAAEIAHLLEAHHAAYGAIDLDWLMWFDVPGLDPGAARRVYLDNVAGVTATYRRAGVRHLVLAVALRDREDLADVRAAAAVPLRIVRLSVPIETITDRLRSDPTTGRQEDLEQARRWVADATGVGIEDLVVANEGAVRDVARGIVAWLGWTT